MDDILENQEFDETSIFQEAMDEPADEFVLSPLEAVENRLMFLRDRNQSFYLGFKAYHDDYDFDQAIEYFQDAIENAALSTKETSANADENEEQQLQEPSSVIVRSMYWQAESYVKIGKMEKAIEVFGKLSRQYRMHHLSRAAERRIEVLRAYHQGDNSA
ncbi:MAG: tetratricopeptide repeat protein [Candidatus Poribacteria bacterium]|nr:tetratricopeptide repeat protein [Candidatus Poribacteria bacterium]